jgi:hypothetical protein
MSSTALDLYHLLPALHRLRDEERRGALRALLEIIQEQAELIRTNIDDLYDDFFIETCAEWVVPYIGDLVANNPLYEVRTTGRADVARTLEYRHGKGTQRVLEQLARDVTGWSAHVVPFFQLIGWTQNLNHLRLTPVRINPRTDPRHGPLSFERVGTVDVRNHEVLDRFGGPFDSVAHTVDARPPGQVNGWHNVHNAGFFLWRLESYPLSDVDARRVQAIAGEHRWHLSPIGGPAELYHEPDRLDDGSLAIESDVSAPIRPAAFFLNTKTYYGPAASLHIVRDGTPIPAAAICCMDLSAWKRPLIDRVGVDVTRGRISFPSGQEPGTSCVVRTTYGFSGETGGGPYGRTIIESEDENTKIVSVPGDAATIGAAITLALTGAQATCVVTIRNNRTFVEDLTIEIGMKSLVIQAESQKRPTLIGSIVVKNGDSGSSNSLTLSGVLVSGAIRCEDVLRKLELVHTTLVPGRGVDPEGAPLNPELPSIWAAATNSELEILLDHSIVGSIVAPAESLGITATDTIVDSASRDGQAPPFTVAAAIAGDAAGSTPGPPAKLDQVTVLGRINVRQLDASNCIFDERLLVQRRQTGCVRFSYVAPGSLTPRRFHCQPESPATEPAFTSRHYGDAAYAQLSLGCAAEIRTGADDGAEMGAFHFLMQPQRETNLRVRLDEYLPFGLQAGLIFVT